MSNETKWSNQSSIDGTTDVDHEGDICVDFNQPVAFVYLNKQDVINFAKQFNIKQEDLK